MNDIQSARILIVDDEPAQMNALRNTLQDEGYDTMGFVSAKKALDALQNHRFDLLLTDLMMAEMDGITLLRTAFETDKDLVAVMMTGHATVDSAIGAMKAGAIDYILKPFKLSILLPVLSRALTLRKLRTEKEALERHLQEKNLELLAINKELEAFSYSVSHDLRRPLRHIDANANLLIEDFASQVPLEAQKFITKIVSNARYMNQLIDDLLRFSRLATQPLNKQAISMSSLVKEVIEELHQGQPERQKEIQLNDIPDTVGDLSLIRQVLINLLSNAFKYTLQQNKTVIEIGCCRQNGETAYFVSDNGIGFDMESAHKLFGVFERLDNSHGFEGTGVGLSIVQRIIHRHGGKVWAEASPRKGATFYFTIPA